MKITLIVTLLFVGNLSLVKAQKIKLKTQADSVSFYFGYMMGRQMTEDMNLNKEIDINILSKGMKDAFDKKEVNLDDMQINELLRNYFEKLQKEAGAKNLEEGEAFLEANKAKEGVITLPSGLQYKVIREGTGTKPQSNQTVDVIYHGTLIDGTVFDSSRERGEPVTLTVTGVIPGFSEALMLMSEGSVWEVYIPSNLGYGERGAGGAIKPNSTLVFEIDLQKVNAEETNEFEETEDTGEIQIENEIENLE